MSATKAMDRQSQALPVIYKVSDLVDVLGMSKGAIRKAEQRGQLKGFRMGGTRLRFRHEDVLQFAGASSALKGHR